MRELFKFIKYYVFDTMPSVGDWKEKNKGLDYCTRRVHGQFSRSKELMSTNLRKHFSEHLMNEMDLSEMVK